MFCSQFDTNLAPFLWTKLKAKEIFFKLKEEKVAIKNRIIRDIRTLPEQDDYYKPTRVFNFWNINYIEYESNVERNNNPQLNITLAKLNLT